MKKQVTFDFNTVEHQHTSFPRKNSKSRESSSDDIEIDDIAKTLNTSSSKYAVQHIKPIL